MWPEVALIPRDRLRGQDSYGQLTVTLGYWALSPTGAKLARSAPRPGFSPRGWGGQPG